MPEDYGQIFPCRAENDQGGVN